MDPLQSSTASSTSSAQPYTDTWAPIEDSLSFEAVPAPLVASAIDTLLQRMEGGPQTQADLLSKLADKASADRRGLLVEGVLQYAEPRFARLGAAISHAGATTPATNATASALMQLVAQGDAASAGSLLQMCKPEETQRAIASLLRLSSEGDSDSLARQTLVRLAPEMPGSYFHTLMAGMALHEQQQQEPVAAVGGPPHTQAAVSDVVSDAVSNTRDLLLSSRPEQDGVAEVGLKLQSLPPQAAATVVGRLLDQPLPPEAEATLFKALVKIDTGRPTWMPRQLAVADALLVTHPDKADAFAAAVGTHGPAPGRAPFATTYASHKAQVETTRLVADTADHVMARLGPNAAAPEPTIRALLQRVTPTQAQQVVQQVLARVEPAHRDSAFAALRDQASPDRLDAVLFGLAAHTLEKESGISGSPMGRHGPGYSDFVRDSKPIVQAAFTAYQEANPGPARLSGNSAESISTIARLLNINPQALNARANERLGKVVAQLTDTGGANAEINGMPFIYAVDDPAVGVGPTALLLVKDKHGQEFAVDEFGSRYKVDNTPGLTDQERFADFFENSPFPAHGAQVAMPTGGRISYDAAGNVQYFTRAARDQSLREHIRNDLNGDLISGGLGVVSGGITALGVAGVATGTALVSAPVLMVAAPIALATNAWDLTNSLADLRALHTHGQTGTFWDYAGLGLSVTGMAEASTLGMATAKGMRASTTLRSAFLAEAAGNFGDAAKLSNKAFDLAQSAAPYRKAGKLFENPLVNSAQLTGNLASFGNAAYQLGFNSSDMPEAEFWKNFAMLGMNTANMSISSASGWWVKAKSEHLEGLHSFGHGGPPKARPLDPATPSGHPPGSDSAHATPAHPSDGGDSSHATQARPPGEQAPSPARAGHGAGDGRPAADPAGTTVTGKSAASPDGGPARPKAPDATQRPASVWAARLESYSTQRTAARQQVTTDAYKNQLYLGREALLRQGKSLDTLNTEALHLEAEAEATQDSPDGASLLARASKARREASRAADQFENIVQRLEPLVGHLAKADVANAEAAATAATAKRVYLEMRQEQNPSAVKPHELEVARTAETDAQQQLKKIQEHTSLAVEEFDHFVKAHANPHRLAPLRRVLDVSLARANVAGTQEQLALDADRLSQVRTELTAAKKLETEAEAQLAQLWQADLAAQAAPGVGTRDAKARGPLLLAVETARTARREVDYKTAELDFQHEKVNLLRTANHAAKNALKLITIADQLHGADPQPVHDSATVRAGQALIQYDGQVNSIIKLAERGFEPKPSQPDMVTGLTYSGTGRHPAYPDIPTDFWPNPVRVQKDMNNEVVLGKDGKPIPLNNNYLRKATKTDWRELAIVNGWRQDGPPPYERFNTDQRLLPGTFKPSSLLHERMGLPGGLEKVFGDIHAHDRGYDHRAALDSQRKELREMYVAIGQPWRSTERYVNSLRPLIALESMATPTNRILHGSIPQGCCGGAPHYSGIDAGRLHMDRGKQTDVEVAREYKAYWLNYKKSSADADAAQHQFKVASANAAAATRNKDAPTAQYWAEQAVGFKTTEDAARSRADTFLRRSAHADMSMTGIDPSKPDTVGHAREMLLDHPGVFKFVGELTIKKEIVDVLLGDESFSINAAEMKRFMDFAQQTGLGVLIHCDWGRHGVHETGHRPVATKTAYEHYPELIEMVSQYPNANIVLAHTGIGRFVRPDTNLTSVTVDIQGKPVQMEVPEHMARVYEALKSAPNLKFDISWNDVAQAYLSDPAMRRSIADFVILFKDKVFFGSDAVSPFFPGMYNQALTTYLPLFKDIALRDPEALWNLLRGNYDGMMAKTEAQTAAWTDRELLADGRRQDADDMHGMHATLAQERERMQSQARGHFDAWVEQLHNNLYNQHAASLGDPAAPPRGSMPVTHTPVPVRIHNETAEPTHQHWVGDPHGIGTPRGNAENYKTDMRASAIAAGSLFAAGQFGHNVLSEIPLSQQRDWHASAYILRAGLGLARSIGMDAQRLDWEQMVEEGRVTNESLDRIANRLITHQKAFNIPDDRLQQALDLTEQFRVDYAVLASKPLDEATGWTPTHRQNVIMSAVGEYQISIDRALGMAVSSLTPYDPRTASGRLWRIGVGTTLGLNLAYSYANAFTGDLSWLQKGYQGGFALSNLANLISVSAGMGSGTYGFNWEQRGPFRWSQAATTAMLTASGAAMTANDAYGLLTDPSGLGAAKVLAGGGFTYASYKQAQVDGRRALRWPGLAPAVATAPPYWQAAAAIGRMGLLYLEPDKKEAQSPRLLDKDLSVFTPAVDPAPPRKSPAIPTDPRRPLTPLDASVPLDGSLSRALGNSGLDPITTNGLRPGQVGATGPASQGLQSLMSAGAPIFTFDRKLMELPAR